MTAKDVLKLAKERGAKIVDLRFIDLPGLWQHFSIPVSELTEEDELAGLDLSQHSETAYALGGGGEYSMTGGAFEEAMRATQAKARPAH